VRLWTGEKLRHIQIYISPFRCYINPMTTSEPIKETLENLPDSPGVYIMRNAEGRVIYVGKAVSLKNRVRNYFQSGTLREQPKTRRLVRDIASIGYVLVKNEAEALMLECNLIKQHHPHYNILLKDSKHFPYLRIDTRQDFPRLEIVRRMPKNDRARYFGPYLGTKSLRHTLDLIRKVFPMRSCGKDIKRAVAHGERPCLNYQLGLCLGPCGGNVPREQYHAMLGEVCAFLAGKHAEIAAGLKQRMREASDALDFERAAALRDKLAAVERVMGSQAQSAISTVQEDLDVLGVHSEGDESAVQLVLVRGGKVTGSESFLLEGTEEESAGQILGSFAGQFYVNSVMLPRAIVVRELPPDAEELAEYLKGRAGRKVEIAVPQRGEKVRLLEMAEANARERMEREKAGRLREWERTGGAMKALGDILNLPAPPDRIECYDISNIQGTDSVASMVVFEHGSPARSQYRRFKIKTVEGANDFESMREVLERRFRHGLMEREQLKDSGEDESTGKFARFPDLVLVDGGRIQLEFGLDAMRSLGVDIPAIGLAKRNEEIILEDREDPVVLPRNSAALHLLERVRDEAHRFAITYHRSLRSARTLKSRLEEVPGIGEKRVKALLRAYPVPAQMEALSVEELAAVEGMNRKAAEAVWGFLHKENEEKGKKE
jgi:excinuclease ABC subunit C